MKPFRLDRRTLLRGAGSVAIALPWLEAMQPLNETRAAELPASRFIAVYTPGGSVLDAFRPTGVERGFTLGPILEPLVPWQQRLVVLQGLDMACAVGDEQQSGMIGLLTGCQQTLDAAHRAGPSLDVVLAESLRVNPLYLAVRWGTGAGGDTPQPGNVISYRTDAGQYFPIAPRLDPAQIWQDLFGTVTPRQDAAWRRSILDGVMARFSALSAKVGGEDRQRLEQHLDMLRELERRVASNCMAPTLVDTADYAPHAFDTPSPASDAALPRVGKLMMDMLVMALSCDITSVATLQWADPSAAFTLPWLSLPNNRTQAYYESGEGGYQPVPLTKIFTWYASQHAYLLEQLASVDRGGHTLLDESVVFFGSQVQHPSTHVKTDMPLLLAGGGGGLAGNRFRTYERRPHNDLLAAIANLFAENVKSYGDPAYCTTPIDDLVS